MTSALGVAEGDGDGLGVSVPLLVVALGDGLSVGDGEPLGVELGLGVVVDVGVGLGVGVAFVLWSRALPIEVPEPLPPPSSEETGWFADASTMVNTPMASANAASARPATAIQRRLSAGSAPRSLLEAKLSRAGSASSEGAGAAVSVAEVRPAGPTGRPRREALAAEAAAAMRRN